MEHFIWGIDPNLISFGSIHLRWYGLMFATAFICGFQFMKWVYLREEENIQNLDKLLFYIVGGTIVGARLGHCIFYDPSYYWAHPLKVLAIWEGGLASHGGGIGVLISLYLYKRKTDVQYLWLLDRLVIPTALAGCFIRIGNFFNSEIIGIPASLPWAVVFERVDSFPRHPVQLYEAISYALIFFVLWGVYGQGKAIRRKGFISGLFLTLIFSSRFMIEFLKTKQEAYSSGVWMSTGQLLSIPFLLAGLIIIFLSLSGRANGKV